MEIARPDLARLILETGVVEFKAKQLKDRSEFPIDFNFRLPPEGNLSPGPINELGALLWQLGERKDLVYDGVVGIPNTGRPFADVIGRYARVPIFELWKRGGGTKRAIVAPPSLRFRPPKDRMLLVDDVVTHGLSKLEAVRAVREAGGIVIGVVALVDREQGGNKALAKKGVRFNAVWRVSELLNFWRTTELISQKRYEEVVSYLNVA